MCPNRDFTNHVSYLAAWCMFFIMTKSCCDFSKEGGEMRIFANLQLIATRKDRVAFRVSTNLTSNSHCYTLGLGRYHHTGLTVR